MNSTTKDHKIILTCDKKGLVNQLFLDTNSLLEDLELPIEMHRLIAPRSKKKLEAFFSAIRENALQEHITLTISHNGKQMTFLCSGYLLNETILLLGRTESMSKNTALKDIMIINTEQANQIRRSEKKVNSIQKEVDRLEINETFLNDFSALNNDLINNKRELMRKNQKIELLNNELKAAYENMSMFTYSVSHDLKEPVRMIRSFLSLLQKKYGDSLDEKGQTYMDFAADGANRLSRMMADLLKYHQSSDINKMETVDLNAAVLEVKTILQNDIKKQKAEITSADLPIVNGSYTGFVQIFQNLISNAIKFVAKGKQPIITIDVKEDNTHYVFSVKDNGIGIAEKERLEVFNLFKRLNSQQQYDGSGIGLAMVRKSIERMGGTVWLESEETKGTTVYFSIRKSLES